MHFVKSLEQFDYEIKEDFDLPMDEECSDAGASPDKLVLNKNEDDQDFIKMGSVLKTHKTLIKFPPI